jgi:hypothetical protein
MIIRCITSAAAGEATERELGPTSGEARRPLGSLEL